MEGWGNYIAQLGLRKRLRIAGLDIAHLFGISCGVFLLAMSACELYTTYG